jgi:hypothetical protein
VKVADINGDGKADLIGRVLQSGQWWLAESTGLSFSNSLWDTWSTTVNWVDVNVGDFGGTECQTLSDASSKMVNGGPPCLTAQA